MKNTANNQARLPDDAPFMGQCQLHEASVFSVLGDNFLVNGPLGLVKAKRASSCLIAPDRGDLVLLCQTQASSYILAVLELCNEKADIVLPKESTFKGQDICLEADRDILFKILHNGFDSFLFILVCFTNMVPSKSYLFIELHIQSRCFI